MNQHPRQLLELARQVGDPSLSILDGRWQITGAALGRQAIEGAVHECLTRAGLDTSDIQFRAMFACTKALHPDPGLVAELYNTWSTLSEACHASSYERPPTAGELRRSFEVIDRFLASISTTAGAAPN